MINKYKLVIFLILLISSFAGAETPSSETYTKPTENFLAQTVYEGMWEKLEALGVSKENEVLFYKIIANESPGFFGYHASSGQEFRILQDVIRIAMEEALEIPIPANFYFLRFPADPDLNLDSVDDFFGRHEVIDNRGSLKSKQLLSLNIPLYGSIERKKSCTVAYFASSQYLPKDKIQISPMLTHFFEEMGVEKGDAAETVAKILEKKDLLNEKQGIILQFFDRSHISKGIDHYFELIDAFGYATDLRAGVPMEDTLSSHHLLDDQKPYPQLRLVMSNFSTLNPFSDLAVLRYDNQDPSSVALWEQHVRTCIQQMAIDKAAKEQYKKALFSLWGLESVELSVYMKLNEFEELAVEEAFIA